MWVTVSVCVPTIGDPDTRNWGQAVYLGGDLRVLK